MRDLRLSTTVLETIALNFSKLPLESLKSLPSSVKSAILRYLVAKDCLTENHLQVLLDEHLDELDFSGCTHISDRALELVSARCPRLKSIRFANCPQVTTKGLELLYSRQSIANSLDLSGTRGVLSSRTVQTMARNCRSLTELVLSDCHELKDKVVGELFHSIGGFLQKVSLARSGCNDVWLKSMADHCPELRYLNLAGCNHLSAFGIGHIVFQCRNLAHLVLADVKSLSEADLQGLVHAFPPSMRHLNMAFVPVVTDAILAVLSKKCPNLVKLNLRGIFHLSGSFIPALFSGCPSLAKLRLDLCKDISEDHIIALLPPPPPRRPVQRPSSSFKPLSLQLRNLQLSGMKNLSDRGLSALASLCPQLEVLNLAGLRYISDAGILTLARCCPKLGNINLSLCGQLTDRSLPALIERCCPSLRYLTLHGTGAGQDTLQAIAQHCSQLVALSLFGLRGVTNQAVAEAVCANTSLRHLDVSNILNLSDDCVAQIALSCPNLASFYAIACGGLTDDGLSHIVCNCPDLSWMNLNGCTKISNRLLSLMARTSRYLTYFSLSGCILISDPGFLLIGRGCPLLKSLTIAAGSSVSANAIKLLSHDRPSLKVVFN
ncbi:MAG: hypothetical protein Q8P67_04640 [archaeon]|nr:hypothetical protein [archaeon]